MQNTWLENRIIKKLAKFLLPAVTSEDAGKTAVVDSSGAWSVGESGGGGGDNDKIRVYEATYISENTLQLNFKPADVIDFDGVIIVTMNVSEVEGDYDMIYGRVVQIISNNMGNMIKFDAYFSSEITNTMYAADINSFYTFTFE